MIIVVNGHYKSASTRLFCGLLELFNQSVPEGFRCTSHKRNPDLIRYLSEYPDIHSAHIVSKIHIYDKSLIQVLKSKGCIFVFTDRNLFDTVISHKYHYEKESLTNLSYSRYLLGVGLIKLIELRIYKHYAKPLSDFVFTYDDVMNKTEFVLSSLNRHLELGYSSSQISAASSLSDFSGRDINLLLGNSDNRGWFTRRPFSSISFKDAFLVRLFIFLSGILTFLLITFGFDKTMITLRHNPYWSALRD